MSVLHGIIKACSAYVRLTTAAHRYPGQCIAVRLYPDACLIKVDWLTRVHQHALIASPLRLRYTTAVREQLLSSVIEVDDGRTSYTIADFSWSRVRSVISKVSSRFTRVKVALILLVSTPRLYVTIKLPIGVHVLLGLHWRH